MYGKVSNFLVRSIVYILLIQFQQCTVMDYFEKLSKMLEKIGEKPCSTCLKPIFPLRSVAK